MRKILNSQFLTLNPSGFTIIELLVVFSVIAIISTIGVASFVTYSRAQALQQAANDVASTLNLAKNSASSQLKTFNVNGQTIQCPTGSVLEGYGVSINISSNNYHLYLACSGNNNFAAPINNLPNKVNFASASDPKDPTKTTNVFFRVLTGGVTGTGNIALVSYGNYKTVVVSSSGAIQMQ